MSEFKHVQWGAGIPVEYQRLMAMMNNDQYLYDKAQVAPRGIIMWKASSAITFNPDGAYQSLTGFTNLSFSCEANRLISLYFHPAIVTSNASPAEARYRFVVDGVGLESSSGVYIATNGTQTPAPLITIPSTALTQGEHTISLEVVATAAISSMVFGGFSGLPILIVRDEGAWVAPAA